MNPHFEKFLKPFLTFVQRSWWQDMSFKGETIDYGHQQWGIHTVLFLTASTLAMLKPKLWIAVVICWRTGYVLVVTTVGIHLQWFHHFLLDFPGLTLPSWLGRGQPLCIGPYIIKFRMLHVGGEHRIPGIFCYGVQYTPLKTDDKHVHRKAWIFYMHSNRCN